MTMYAIQFTVTSRYPFPLDMLRYDACWPEGSDDAAQIGYSLDPNEAHLKRDQPFTVRLLRYSPSSRWKPTGDRWASFLWSLDPRSIQARKMA